MDVKRLSPNASLPRYATPGAAGMDLCACLSERVTLAPGERALIPTGLAVSIPQGYVGLVFARSGLAVKQGVALSNGVGVIDWDYRGEVKVGLVNLGRETFTVEHGARIAQMVVLPVEQMTLREVAELDDTDRGAGGFGSTGI